MESFHFPESPTRFTSTISRGSRPVLRRILSPTPPNGYFSYSRRESSRVARDWPLYLPARRDRRVQNAATVRVRSYVLSGTGCRESLAMMPRIFPCKNDEAEDWCHRDTTGPGYEGEMRERQYARSQAAPASSSGGREESQKRHRHTWPGLRQCVAEW